MKKVIIIGGGVAGLTAGFFSQLYGFESEIYESHSIVGGECTGWTRDGFHIDNCIHWLTGTKKDTEIYELWKQLGVLGDNVEIISPDEFYTSHIDGKTVTLYRDIEKTKAELLEISPDDKDEINSFIDAVKASFVVQVPVEMPMDMMPKLKMMKLGMSMMGVLKYMKKYGKINMKQFSEKFKSPILRTFFSDYMDPRYSAFSYIFSYATFADGNGDIPRGGSLKAVQRIAEKYKASGGKIHTSSPVKSININGNRAESITLENGETVEADYIIPACDTSVTFGKLLDKKFMPKQLAESYENSEIMSIFQVTFAADDLCRFINITDVFDCKPITIANTSASRMSIRNYNYEPSFAPSGKTVLRTGFLQDEKDFDYWEKLYTSDKTAYDRKKQELAEEILCSVTEFYPQLKGKLRIIDVTTPYTYYRFTNAYKGAYMGFIADSQKSSQPITGLIDGLDNVVIGSQWIQTPGGLPIAVMAGKFAAQRIANKEWGN